MSNDDYRAVFSERLKYFMKLNSKNQSDLIRYMGISSSTASDWCNGKKMPRMDKIQSLANWLHVEKSDLIEDKVRQSLPLLLIYYEKLNDIGKKEAEKRVEELTHFSRYTEEEKVVHIKKEKEVFVNAAHAIEGASKEDIQYDEDIMNDEDF